MESSAAATAARDRGVEWLSANEPGATIDARALRLLIEQGWGQAARRADALNELLEGQHPDGGWGWQPNDPSEAWPTGVALYVLSQCDDDGLDSAMHRGRDFLVNTQLDDGSWLVEGKLTSSSEMSSYFGTVWAIVGLSRTLPAK
jgi:squalene-hopene/tetraprenyl-beta-curcumene cyclase